MLLILDDHILNHLFFMKCETLIIMWVPGYPCDPDLGYSFERRLIALSDLP